MKRMIWFISMICIFAWNIGFSQQRPTITVFCVSEEEKLEIGDVVMLSNEPMEEKMYGRISIPKVKRTIQKNEVFGVVIGTGAKLLISEPDESLLELRKMLKDAIKRGASQEELDKIQLGKKEGLDAVEVAIFGIVEECKIDITSPDEEINVGDSLTSSEKPGYARKIRESELKPKIPSDKTLENIPESELRPKVILGKALGIVSRQEKDKKKKIPVFINTK